MARVADVHTDMRDFRRRIERHLGLSLFSARRTINSPEIPLVRAEHADQGFLRSVAQASQNADDRICSAQRASERSSARPRGLALIREEFGVGLKKNPREQSIGIF